MQRTDEYDYIVVGAGSRRAASSPAGWPRTATRGCCSLEAGGSDRTRFCTVPGMISIIHTVPQVKKRFDWGYYTVPQPNAAGPPHPDVRGRVLGGSSAINGMVFVRGHRTNYDDWAADGCTGWGYDDVLPASSGSRTGRAAPDDYRGAGGPIGGHRAEGPDAGVVARAHRGASPTTCDVPVLDDYNARDAGGRRRLPDERARRACASARRRRTCTGGRAANLDVQSGVTVARVVIEGAARGRRRGRSSGGASAASFARAREVILSARRHRLGAAPHALGRRAGRRSCAQHGIGVVADLPVGENLHDHLFVPMTFLAPSAMHRGTAWHFFSGMLAESVRGDVVVRAHGVRGARRFVRSRHAKNGVPDLQILTPAVGLPVAQPGPAGAARGRHAAGASR